MVDAARTLDQGVAALLQEPAGRLRLASSLTVAEYLLPGWLVSVGADHPEVATSLHFGNSAAVADMVLRDAADIGFVETPTLPQAGLPQMMSTRVA